MQKSAGGERRVAMTCWILFKRNNNVIGMPPEETALVSGQFECGLSESTLIEDYLLTYATGWLAAGKGR